MTKEEFQQAIQRLRPRLKEQAFRYLADGEEAEDAVQDALLRLWQMHEQLTPPIDGMAIVLIRNICVDLLRRRQHLINSDVLAIGTTTETDDHECIERMMEAVDTLPGIQQTLLRLRYIQGMEMKELASLFQMSAPAVRKALSRARMAVRKQYYRRLLVVVSVALLAGLVGTLLFRHGQEEECEAYIYGRRTTDREVVMGELERSAKSMAADNRQDDVERQLNEMFNIE